MTQPVTGSRHYLIKGHLIEVWENPTAAFSCSPSALRRYAASGSWVMLFNALALPAAREGSA